MKCSSISRIVIGLVLTIFSGAAVFAQTTEFTYQGKLTDGGSPPTGTYEFEFRLYDSLANGNQVGPTLTLPGVSVAGGVFTVRLDFGAQFTGAPRWLQIGVANVPGPFTLLAPRQPLSSTPYSVRSLNTGTADALSAACVGCVTAAQVGSVSGASISGSIPVASVPAGSGSYIQNQNAGPQASSDFNISGSGSAAGTLTAGTVRANTQFNFGGNPVLRVSGSGLGPFSNTFLGVGSGTNTPASSTSNTFVGNNAGQANLGFGNSYIGAFAGETATGGGNTFLGSSAGRNSTSGGSNTLIGSGAGVANSGSGNTYVGAGATSAASTQSNNTTLGSSTTVGGLVNYGTAIGSGSAVGQSNSIVLGRPNGADTVLVPGSFAMDGSAVIGGSMTIYGGFTVDNFISRPGTQNTFVGTDAGTPTGSNNSYFGYVAGDSTSGSDNTFMGSDAGGATTTGSGNTFIGRNAGDAHTTGSNNTALGNGADVGATVTFATAIGAGSEATVSNLISLGRSDGSDRTLVRGILDLQTLVPGTTVPLCRNSSNHVGDCPAALPDLINQQRALIEKQQKTIDALKKIICQTNREADVCRE